MKKYDENGVEIIEPVIAPNGSEELKDKKVEVLPTEEIDYKKLSFDLLDENKKLAEERDNYKTGLLNAKRGSESPEDIKDLKSSLENLTALVQTVTKENKEIKIALANKSQVIQAPAGGSGEHKDEKKDNFFTEEQLKFLQKKGLNPETVKSNMLKAKEKTV